LVIHIQIVQLKIKLSTLEKCVQAIKSRTQPPRYLLSVSYHELQTFDFTIFIFVKASCNNNTFSIAFQQSMMPQCCLSSKRSQQIQMTGQTQHY